MPYKVEVVRRGFRQQIGGDNNYSRVGPTPDEQLNTYLTGLYEKGVEVRGVQQTRADYASKDNPSTYIILAEFLITLRTLLRPVKVTKPSKD